MATKAVILGCAGLELTDWEKSFFSDFDPLGFILFARNCETPDQIKALTAALRDTVGRCDAPVLIDQEGGRVARLRPPHWRAAPAARCFGALSEKDSSAACEAVEINGQLLALELAELGIDVDCAPVLDIPVEGAHDIVGDRAFGPDAETVIALAQPFCRGMMAGGVVPVIKHIPGHGRATTDSHEELPVVAASVDILRGSDFRPFAALSTAPWAMTAHIIYKAFDPTHPASTSKIVIRDVIRGELGFDGFLVSDDLSMKALSGDMGHRAEAVMAAGCDAVLHCNGDQDEMLAVATAAVDLSPASLTRFQKGRQRLGRGEGLVWDDLVHRLEQLTGLPEP